MLFVVSCAESDFCCMCTLLNKWWVFIASRVPHNGSMMTIDEHNVLRWASLCFLLCKIPLRPFGCLMMHKRGTYAHPTSVQQIWAGPYTHCTLLLHLHRARSVAAISTHAHVLMVSTIQICSNPIQSNPVQPKSNLSYNPIQSNLQSPSCIGVRRVRATQVCGWVHGVHGILKT